MFKHDSTGSEKMKRRRQQFKKFVSRLKIETLREPCHSVIQPLAEHHKDTFKALNRYQHAMKRDADAQIILPTHIVGLGL